MTTPALRPRGAGRVLRDRRRRLDVGLFERTETAADLLIGEEAQVGRGLGPEILRAFLAGRPGSDVALVDEESPRSWRAFEKAGFRRVGGVEEEGRPHRVMRVG